MNRKTNEDLDIKQLEEDIEELREVLNKICLMAKTEREIEERLIVSQQLDKLIIEYINKAYQIKHTLN